MLVLLLLVLIFVPAFLSKTDSDFEYKNAKVEQAIIPILLIAAAVVSLAVGIYTFLQMRKMQKKNQPKASQLDGTIADEGVSFRDIAGSPHIHPNITEIWDKSTSAIKQKSGGFLGIGSSSTVTGYRYYAKFAALIGNRIEKFIAINFDNRGWIVHDETKHPFNMLPVNAPSLFGQDAGGVAGNIDLEFGYPNPQQNATYKKHFDLVSAYPYESYLVFRGNTIDSSFYLGNSGYMKEMLLWVKRTRVKNDGEPQWYATTPDRPWVCEINGFYVSNESEFIPKPFTLNVKRLYSGGTSDNNVDFINNSFYPGQVTGGSGTSGLYFFEGYHEENISFINTSAYDILIGVKSETIGQSKSNNKNYQTWVESGYAFKESAYCRNSVYDSDSNRYVMGASLIIYFLDIRKHREFVKSSGSDINPIHKIREILTDDTAMAKPEIYINDVNFMKAADRIWDEGLGISWAIDEKSCLDAIEELCYHIEAGVRVNRQTGLYEMVLFRDDWFAENEIHEITENMIKDLSLEIMNSDDVVNQLNVTYYDRNRIKNSTFSVYENGSILTIGKANAESIDFPYFMDMRNAEVVANWKLKQYSTPAWKGEFTTGWREARKWNRYDLVKINWSKKWQGTILARIMLIDLGDGRDNTVRIEFEEVVPYSGEMNTSIVVDDSTAEVVEPAKPSIGETFEAPYYLAVQNIGQRKVDEELAYNQDVGYTFSTYRKPQWNALYTEITSINADNPENGWVIDGNAEFVTSGQFDQLVSRTATQITVKNLQIEDSLNQGDLIVVGSWIIGNVGQYEFMIIESFDAETSILTVKRGALDTIPFEWGVDTNFWHSKSDDGLFSLTEYSAGQNVRASSLTVTPSSKLEQLGSAPVYMRSRAIRPYPPANVKINGDYFPAKVETDLTVTWAHRNRLDLDIIDWYSDSVDVESGVMYNITITGLHSDTIIYNETVSSNSITLPKGELESLNKIELNSIRDGYESLEKYTHIFSATQDLSSKIIGASFLSNTSYGSGTLSLPAGTQIGDVLLFVVVHRAGKPLAYPIGDGWVKITEQLISSTNEENSASAKVSVWQKTATNTENLSFWCSNDYRSAAIYTIRNAFINVIEKSALGEITVAKNQDSSLLVLVCANSYSDTGSSSQILNQSDYLGRSLVLFAPNVFYSQQAHYLTQAMETTSVEVSLIEHAGKLPTYARETIVIEIL